MTQSLRPLFYAMLGCAALAITGCEAEDPEVSKDSVEKSSQETLTKTVGKPAPPITCPSGLKAKVGATLICTITLDSKPYDVTIKVTAVHDADVKYDVVVADKPKG